MVKQLIQFKGKTKTDLKKIKYAEWVNHIPEWYN